MSLEFDAIKNPPAICFWRWVLLPVQNLMFLSSPGTLPQKTRNSCRCAHRCHSHGLLGNGSHLQQAAWNSFCCSRVYLGAGGSALSPSSKNSTSRSISRRRPPMTCKPLSCWCSSTILLRLLSSSFITILL